MQTEAFRTMTPAEMKKYRAMLKRGVPPTKAVRALLQARGKR